MPLHITADKVYGYIRKYEKTRYLALFYSEIFNEIFNRIRYLIRLKSSIPICSHNAKAKSDSDDDLPLDKNSNYT